MGTMTLALYGQSFCALAFAAVLLFRALRRKPLSGPPPSRWLPIALFLTVLWAGALAAAHYLSQPALAVGAELLDRVRYGAWFALLLATVRPAIGARRWRTWSVGAALLVLANLLPIAPRAIPAGVWMYLWLALPIVGLALVEQVFRHLPSDFRWHAKPLCLALAAAFLFDLYLFSQVALFGRVDPDSAVMRGFVHGAGAVLLLASMRREFVWLSTLQVSRAVAFHSVTLLLVGVYLLFMAAAGYYVRDFGGTWGGALQVGLLAAGLLTLVALLASSELRAKLRVFVGKHFFRYRYDYRTEWLRFTEMLTSSTSPQETGERVIKGLAAMLHSPGGAMWLVDTDRSAIVQSAWWNLPRCTQTLLPDGPLARFLAEREWIIDLDDVRRHPERQDAPPPPDWLLAMPQAWAVVPLVVGGELIGVVVLARPHASPHLNWEVRDLLKTAARQAASMLVLMRTTEALLEVRKFDAFNRMSAFVVHDLKNIVAQLSLMAQNAQRLKHNPEFQDDMVETVQSSLEKMRRLMLQLREGQSPVGVLSGVELAPVLQRLQSRAGAAGRTLQLQVDEPVVARGHDERIERVIGHVVQNALDATPEAGSVSVRLDRQGSLARVVVSDTGCGMTPEFVHLQLFKPFNTTKRNGMGIGAYESHQYVRELGGSIQVDSEVGRGTTVTLLLPLIEAARARSDLELASAK